MKDPIDRDRSALDALKATVDLAAVVQSCGVELRKVGRHLAGRCAFHDDQEASLIVNTERQLWNCFGCQQGGDVIRFLERKEGLTFKEAVARLQALAGQPGMNGRPATNGQAKRKTPKGPAPPEGPAPAAFAPADLLARVAEHYARTFASHPGAQHYLQSRGLDTPDLWTTFQVGFADGSLLKRLPDAGDVRDALTQLGVLNAEGKEHFRGCVVTPLHHPDQGIVGLYGRRIAPDSAVRHLYLPGPQRGVFNLPALEVSRQLTVAESVLDAMSLWQAGLHTVTGLFGVKNIPPDLDALLGRYGIQEVRFCLDGDKAGREATERFAAKLSQRGIRCLTAMLPDGQDPNSLLVAQGATALRTLAEQQIPVLEAGTGPATPPVSKDRPPTPDGPQLEPTGDGYLLHCGQLTYRVTPRAPFNGRLRVTVRATQGEDAVVDTIDLYQARSRATLMGQLRRSLQVPQDEVERHFLLLIDHTEAWVHALTATDAEAKKSFQVPDMTPAEKEAARAFLCRSDLVDAVLLDMQNLGYVGEEKPKLLAYLIGISRKLERPMAGIIVSQSGAGKSAQTELVELLTPPEDVVLYSRLSALAIAYMPKDCIKRKLVILEERVGGEAADYSIRVLLSRQKFTQAVVVKDPTSGNMMTRTFEVEGPIAYLETTTNPRVNPENASRAFDWGVDESEEQTARIHRIQRQNRNLDGLHRAQDGEAIRTRHHHLQRLLEPVRVLIPYADLLSFPTRWLRTRRDNERFLTLIEAVAFLHQYQREGGVIPHPDGPIRYIVATVEDYTLAYQLACEVLGATLHELTRAAQELWTEARGLVAELCRVKPGQKTEDIVFTRRALREYCGWNDRRLRDALSELVEMEYVAAVGSQGKTYHYRLLCDSATTPSPLGQLTTPQHLAALLVQRSGAGGA